MKYIYSQNEMKMTPEKIMKKLQESNNYNNKKRADEIQQIISTTFNATERIYAIGLFLKEMKIKDLESYSFVEKETEEYLNFWRANGGYKF